MRFDELRPYCTHTRTRVREGCGKPSSKLITAKFEVGGGTRCLIPYDRWEGLTTAEAAARAARTERTLRMWCRDHDIGRHVAGGPWLVSRVALAMFLNDDVAALRAYLSGVRASSLVAYFQTEGLGDLFSSRNK